MAKAKTKSKQNWAKTAIKHPGAFRSWCKKNGYSSANTSCIRKGKKSSNATVRRRAILADNLRKIRARRKKKKK